MKFLGLVLPTLPSNTHFDSYIPHPLDRRGRLAVMPDPPPTDLSTILLGLTPQFRMHLLLNMITATLSINTPISLSMLGCGPLPLSRLTSAINQTALPTLAFHLIRSVIGLRTLIHHSLSGAAPVWLLVSYVGGPTLALKRPARIEGAASSVKVVWSASTVR